MTERAQAIMEALREFHRRDFVIEYNIYPEAVRAALLTLRDRPQEPPCKLVYWVVFHSILLRGREGAIDPMVLHNWQKRQIRRTRRAELDSEFRSYARSSALARMKEYYAQPVSSAKPRKQAAGC